MKKKTKTTQFYNGFYKEFESDFYNLDFEKVKDKEIIEEIEIDLDKVEKIVNINKTLKNGSKLPYIIDAKENILNLYNPEYLLNLCKLAGIKENKIKMLAAKKQLIFKNDHAKFILLAIKWDAREIEKLKEKYKEFNI